MTSKTNNGATNGQEWIKIIRKYSKPDIKKSIWQIINSLIPFIALWYLMYLSLEISYFLTLGLSIIAAAFLARIFIIFHDCGHGSFFKSKKANKLVGSILGLFTFTPYDKWHLDHAIHHSNVGNLDKRGTGDVMTLTVEEYEKMSKAKRFSYRIYRHPVFLFGVAPFLLFVVQFRLIRKTMSKSIRTSVHLTNLYIILLVTALVLLMGWKAYLMIQLPVTYFSSVAGVWLFYLQHQFEDVKWTRTEEWDYKKMALEGSSYLKFPRILQWFSGNIGFHHVHHLGPKIPNYNLEKCHRENSMFHSVKAVKFIPSIKTMTYRLWDEKNQHLVSIPHHK